jgi:hypothetical protein
MFDNPNTNLSASNFNSTAYLFNNLGLSINDFVDDLNRFTAVANGNNSVLIAGQLGEEMSVFANILDVSAMFSSNSLGHQIFLADGSIDF